MSTETFGNRETFGDIVRRYQDMVSAVTFSMTGNLQQSEDLAQETFVTAWQNQRELRDPEKLPAWLCGIARNLSRNWLRRTESERRNRSHESFDEMQDELLGGAVCPNPAGKLEREEQAALLWATLEKIPELYREPLVMFYRQNQAVAEIATALETSEDNVRQRLVRGRAYLKEEVQQLVESALETLRPDTGFALGVLAALPAMAVSATATAATGVATATTTATTSATGTGVVGKGFGMGDMIGMGVLTGSASACPSILGLMQPNPWVGYVIIGVTVVGFLIFAKFIAGKPKVRHLGWAATCFFYMFFYGWIYRFALREPLARFPEMQLSVLFIYALFLFCGIGGIMGYIGLFEKEIDKKWGTGKKE